MLRLQIAQFFFQILHEVMEHLKRLQTYQT
eukprot:UN11278